MLKRLRKIDPVTTFWCAVLTCGLWAWLIDWWEAGIPLEIIGMEG